MARESGTSMQKSEGQEMRNMPEQTRSGAVYTPAVDIFENDHSITVLADMPGVKADDLQIDLRDSLLTLTGRVAQNESPLRSAVLSEYQSGMFYRQFTLSEAIDQSKIDAKLRDGVLHLELPKVEKARPRKITVRSD